MLARVNTWNAEKTLKELMNSQERLITDRMRAVLTKCKEDAAYADNFLISNGLSKEAQKYNLRSRSEISREAERTVKTVRGKK
jgi:hypothetical protein